MHVAGHRGDGRKRARRSDGGRRNTGGELRRLHDGGVRGFRIRTFPGGVAAVGEP